MTVASGTRARSRPERLGGRIALLAWLAGLGVALVALETLGRAAALPHPVDPTAWRVHDDDEAVRLLIASLRTATMGWCLWLVVATVVAATRVRRGVPVPRLGLPALVGRAVEAGLRPTAALVVTVGLVASTASGAAAGPVGHEPTLGAAASPAVTFDLGAEGSPSGVLLPSIGAGSSGMARPEREVAVLAPSSWEPAPFETTPTPPGTRHEYTIERGDHLWSVAEHHIERVLGRPATPREVGRYWRRVVAANLDRLVVPGEPDLVVPGQRIVLPPIRGAR